MYTAFSPTNRLLLPRMVQFGIASTLWFWTWGNMAVAQPQVIRNITQASERLELTVNTSRILTLDKRIPRMVVNNPELVTVTPISANQVQLAARKPGVTQVNLWDEDDQVYTVDVLIYGDVRELELALQRLFPDSSVKVVRLTNSLVLEGFVEKPEAVSPILRLAEDYAPKVVNNITVGGVQQILLKVKIMEVSRTKLRNLGHDFAHIYGDDFLSSGVSGLLQTAGVTTGVPAGVDGTTFRYGVMDGNSQFFGFLEALKEDKLAKILADPTITTVSGRPARFNVGGEFPIIIPSGLGQSTIEFKPFGTEVNFVPIVLGNGNIRLEVRPRVSERDDANGIQQNGFNIPALTGREVDTGVEMKAGQTLALAGLVQTRIESQKRGLPYFGDLPYIGAAFRSVKETHNEIELLILVTPEFADGMDPHEVPQCGPGMETVSPSNCDLYWGGKIEVPACGPCAPQGCGLNCANFYNNPQQAGCVVTSDQSNHARPMPTPAVYDVQGSSTLADPGMQSPGQTLPTEAEPAMNAPIQVEPTNPAETMPTPTQPVPQVQPADSSPVDSSAMRMPTPWYQARQPVEYIRQSPQNPTIHQPTPTATPTPSATSTPGLIGPLGYDM